MRHGKNQVKPWRHAAAFGSVLLLGMAAHAQTTRTWSGGNGNWDVPGNWSGNNVPDTSTEIADTNTTTDNTITLNLSDGTTIHSLLLRSGDTVNFTSTGGNRTINVAQNINIAGTFSIVNTGSGTKSLSKSAGTGTLTNSGTIHIEIDGGTGGSNISLAGRAASDSGLPAILHTNTGTININQNNSGSALAMGLLVTGFDSTFRNQGTLNIGNGTGTLFRNTSGIFEQAAGTTTVGTTSGSTGSLRAKFVNVTGGVFKGTGIISAGNASDPATLTVSGGTIAPGVSIGTLTVGTSALPVNNFNFTGGTYEWELGALSTASPGTNFDQIVLATGNLSITGGSLLPVFVGSASAPDMANAFWQSVRSWTIISNTGGGTASGTLAVDNSAWASHGSFSTLVSGNSLLLSWAPIPEPATLAMLALGGLMILGRSRTA